jgi:hypothetical protein
VPAIFRECTYSSAIYQPVIPYGLGLLRYVLGTSRVRQDLVDLSVFMGINYELIKERPEHSIFFFFAQCLDMVVEHRRRGIVVITAAGKDIR